MSIVEVKVKVIPGARENGAVGFEGDILKVKLTAPPIEGKANKALVELLARLVGIRKGNVEIVKGLKSRQKLIRLTDVDEDVLRKFPRL